MGELENHTQDYTAEMEILKEEKLELLLRLEDQENRDSRSDIWIRGIPEMVHDQQATMLSLFQELQPGIPVERLEMGRVYRALSARKVSTMGHYGQVSLLPYEGAATCSSQGQRIPIVPRSHIPVICRPFPSNNLKETRSQVPPLDSSK